MDLAENLLIGISLSMDALAVSLTLGACGRTAFDWKKILLTAFFFGAFQAAMPSAGWCGTSFVGSIVQQYGKFAAALLLFLLGGKMTADALRKHGEEKTPSFGLKALTVLAFATSIDAFLIGISYACLGHVWSRVLPEVLLIGITTFLISSAGCIAGRMTGALLGERCNLLGGLVLIGIGVKVLIAG